MSNRFVGSLMIAFAILALLAAAFVSYELLSEAYGTGPPYYSRTTNMDKWNDPLPEVLIADVIVAAVSFHLVRVGMKTLRNGGSPHSSD